MRRQFMIINVNEDTRRKRRDAERDMLTKEMC